MGDIEDTLKSKSDGAFGGFISDPDFKKPDIFHQEEKSLNIPHWNPDEVDILKSTDVECPVCHKKIEIPEYDHVTRTDALKQHIEEKHGIKKDIDKADPHKLVGEDIDTKIHQHMADFLSDELADYLKEKNPRELDPAKFEAWKTKRAKIRKGLSELISDIEKAKPELGSGKRFEQLSGKLEDKDAKDPDALAAYIGRKKYGKKKFQGLAAGGKKMEKAVDKTGFNPKHIRLNRVGYFTNPESSGGDDFQIDREDFAKIKELQDKGYWFTAPNTGKRMKKIKTIPKKMEKGEPSYVPEKVEKGGLPKDWKNCTQCGTEMTPAEAIGGPVCMKCSRKNQAKVTGRSLPKHVRKALGQIILTISKEIEAEIAKSLPFHSTKEEGENLWGGKKEVVRVKVPAGKGYLQAPKPGNYYTARDIAERERLDIVPEEMKKAKEEKCLVNPAKERAALRVRKAIILTDKQLGKSFEPVTDEILFKAFGSEEAIPDLMKDDRMSQEFFVRGLERASLFDENPIIYVCKLWYGDAKFEKAAEGKKQLIPGALLGGGIGSLLGHPLAGAAIGAGAGTLADKLLPKKDEKMEKDLVSDVAGTPSGKDVMSAAERSRDKAHEVAFGKSEDDIVPWTKAEFNDIIKKVFNEGSLPGALIGGGIGSLVGHPVAGAAIGAGAGSIAADKLKEKKEVPESTESSETSKSLDDIQKIGPAGLAAIGAVGEAAPKVGRGISTATPEEIDIHVGKHPSTSTRTPTVEKPQTLEKSDGAPKMIKDKCVKLCKAIVKIENSSDDLSTLTDEQFSRALIQSMFDIEKAVAEPIDSKYSPKERKPTTDFGGESEVSHNPTTADPSVLMPATQSKIVRVKDDSTKEK